MPWLYVRASRAEPGSGELNRLSHRRLRVLPRNDQVGGPRHSANRRGSRLLIRYGLVALYGSLALRRYAAGRLPCDPGFFKVVRGPVASRASDRAGAGYPGISRGVGRAGGVARGSVGAVSAFVGQALFLEPREVLRYDYPDLRDAVPLVG
jgi:hypothetical protein